MEIINNCSKTPLGLKLILRRSLRYIGLDEFEGISKIVLEESNSSYLQSIPENITELISQKYRVLGFYCPKTETDFPYIMLFVNEIYKGIPFPLTVTPILLIRITNVLAHELAHHLISEKGISSDETIETDEAEEVEAKKYAENLVKKFRRKFLYNFWNWCLVELSNWHVAIAQADFRSNRLETAGDHFYTAWQLNPQNSYAGEWYWLVREKLSINSKEKKDT